MIIGLRQIGDGIRLAAYRDMKRNRITGAQAGDAAQETLVAAMLEPAFYPNRPEEILHKETHISHIFLAGDLVYKLKKPVRFAFLDFSTAAKRRHFLDAELRLNRRLAPAIYLGVVPICRDSHGWRFAGADSPCEHALLMRRMPEKRMLDYLLKTRQATAAMMEQLADRLAAFHLAAAPVRKDSDDHVAATGREWRKNLAELRPLLAKDKQRDFEAIAAAGDHFLRRHAALVSQRAANGWIRDVHGDLHAEHICFAPEGIQVFDCIEFSDELRRCDLASEIAFLLMDLSVRGGEPLVQRFLRPYLRKLNDPHMAELLPFYQCYRALVRAKVHALGLHEWNDEAERYFDFAKRLKWHRYQPFLVLVSGFTGSGKSTLARALGARLGVSVINSDETRKRIAGIRGSEIVPLNAGIYSPAMTGKTYDAMAKEAESEVRARRGVILDGTFGARAQREKFIQLARSCKIPLSVIRCRASDAVSAQRLRHRAMTGENTSDGRWEIYLAQTSAYEPMDEIPADSRLELCTEAPTEKLAMQAEDFLAAQFDAN